MRMASRKVARSIAALRCGGSRKSGLRTPPAHRSHSLQADACGPGYTYDSHTRLKLEAKDRMRARGTASPDEWDAVALTFAEPVADVSNFNRKLEYTPWGIA